MLPDYVKMYAFICSILHKILPPYIIFLGDKYQNEGELRWTINEFVDFYNEPATLFADGVNWQSLKK